MPSGFQQIGSEVGFRTTWWDGAGARFSRAGVAAGVGYGAVPAQAQGRGWGWQPGYLYSGRDNP